MAAETCDVVIEDCKSLVLSLKELMNRERLSYATKEPYQTLFEGYYEEIKSTFNKVIRACEQEDETTAYFRALSIQEETSLFIAKAEEGIWYDNVDHYQWYRKGFDEAFDIDLISLAVKKDFIGLKTAIQTLDLMLKKLLIDKGVELAIYDDFDSLSRVYKERT